MNWNIKYDHVNVYVSNVHLQNLRSIFLTGNIILLQLVKIEVLDPSGGVLSLYVDFICLRIHNIQIWRRLDLKQKNYKYF